MAIPPTPTNLKPRVSPRSLPPIGVAAVSVVWLTIGIFIGPYLFRETVEKVVTKTVVVERRIEVPVDRVVYKDVIKEVVREVEKVVEVPVERVVIKEIAVPVPMRLEAPVIRPAAEPSRWDSMQKGMTKAEVSALLGAPARVTETDGEILWHYDEKGQGALFVRFKAGGLLASDKVDLFLAPDRRVIPKAHAGAKLLEMALKAKQGGNAALALVYAQSALSVEPSSQPIKELVGSLITEISGQTPPR